MKKLSGSKLFDQEFKNLALPSEIIAEKTFRNCTFINCNLSDGTFKRCSLEGCVFIHCNLSLLKIPQTYFQDTLFKDCRMMGINWCQADWDLRSLLSKKRVDFERCLLDHSLFIGLDLREVNFQNCKASNLDFEEANLERADFSGTDLKGTRFFNCDLSNANFASSVNYAINAGQNKLHQTRFSLPEAISLLHCLDILLDEDQ